MLNRHYQKAFPCSKYNTISRNEWGDFVGYHDVLKDSAKRTQKNLEFIEKTKRDSPFIEVFEVTQLINSLLGLLVFPKEYI